jgi:predicted transporter protein
MPVIILLSFVIKTHFHGGEFEITVSNIAFAIGMIAGSMILYIRNFKTHKAKIEMWSYAFFGSFFIISGLLPENFFWPFAIIMVIIGVMMSITQSASMALMQEKIPQEKLGRVLSLYMGLASIPSIIGLLCANNLMALVG